MAPASRHFRIEKLGRGLYAAIATQTGYGLCNSAIVDLGGRTAVFDSMLTPMAGADLARTAERLTGHAPSWVINSHCHGDHIWGNSAFGDGHVVSSRKVRDAVLRRSQTEFDACRRAFPKMLAGLSAPGSTVAAADRPRVRGWFQGVVDTPPSLRIVPPEVTFEQELVLEGSRRALHLITYGGGHSPSDVFGYLPDERLLFAGDLAMVGLHPSVGDGWTGEWIRILGRMQELRISRVLPGHGPMGGRETLPTVERYLRDLETAVRRAIRQGATLREVQAMPIPARYRDWRFAFMFPENVARVYQLTKPRRRARA